VCKGNEKGGFWGREYILKTKTLSKAFLNKFVT